MATQLEYRDGIAVLTLGDDENRFTAEWLDTVNAQLDEIEENARGLVTVGSDRFYSNGLDLEWLTANPDRMQEYVDRVHAVFSRVLTYSLPTAAAVNGHAFGAGAMLAIAHDFRFMREDRGYYCFPEIDINIPFTPGMAALIQAKVTPQTAVASMTTGHRYGGPEAAAAGLVDGALAESELVGAAVDRIAPIAGKNRDVLRAIKSTMFETATKALAAG